MDVALLQNLRGLRLLEPESWVRDREEVRGEVAALTGFPEEYILHLVAAGVAGGARRLNLSFSPTLAMLEIEQPPLPASILSQLSELIYVHGLRRPLQQLVLGLARAVAAGARARVTSALVCYELSEAGCEPKLATEVANGLRLDIAWPARSRVLEPDLLQRRCRFCPVPLEVNGALLNPPMEMGTATVVRHLRGAAPAPVSYRASLRTTGESPGLWAELALGGAWFLDGAASRVHMVVDGLTYSMEHLDLGCKDLRAVVVAGDLVPDARLNELHRNEQFISLMAVLRHQLETAKADLVNAFPLPEPGGPGLWHLLREIVGESRARGQLSQTLDLCERVLAHPELTPASQGVFRELAAGMASRLERHEEALRLADQAIDGKDLSGLGLAARLDTLGLVRLEAGRPLEAQEALLRAEKVKRELLEDQEPQRVAQTLQRMAAVSLVQGRSAEAERYGKRAVARCIEGLGESHPEVGQALLRLSQVYMQQDRLEEGRRLVEQALGLLNQDDLATGQALLYASLFDLLADRLESAREGARWALQLMRPGLGSDHPDLSGCYFLSGLICMRMGQADEGRQRLRESLRIRSVCLGEQHTDVAATRLALAQGRLREGQCDPAREHLLRALETYQAKLGPDHPATGRARDLLGQALMAASDLEAAERETVEAVRILNLTLQSGDPQALFRDSAGTIGYHWWRGQEDQAMQTPLVLPPRRLGQEQEDLALAQAHLARILRRQGRLEEAEVSARVALRIRSCRGQATLVREAGALVRLGPEAIAVRLRLQAPGRILSWLRLDTARGRVALAAESEVPQRELMLVLVEPQRKLLQNDSAIFTSPFQEGEHSFLLYAADQGSSRISAIPYVVTAGFREGPPLRVPVRL